MGKSKDTVEVLELYGVIDIIFVGLNIIIAPLISYEVGGVITYKKKG